MGKRFVACAAPHIEDHARTAPSPQPPGAPTGLLGACEMSNFDQHRRFCHSARMFCSCLGLFAYPECARPVLCRAPPVSSLVSGARPDGTGRRSPPAVSTKDKSAPPLTPYWFCVPALARAYGCGRAIAERDNHSTSGNGTSLRQQLRQRSFRALSLQPISSTNTTSPSRLRRFLIAFCRGATLADVIQDT